MLLKKGYIEPEFNLRHLNTICVLSGSDMWSDSLTNDFGQDDFYGGLNGGNNG